MINTKSKEGTADNGQLGMWRNAAKRLYYKLRKQQWILKSLWKNPIGMVGAGILAAMIFCAIFAPYITPHNAIKTDTDHRFEGPSTTYILGTDYLGRGIFSRIIYSARTVVPMIFAVVFFGATIGVILGLIAGFFSGTILEKILIWIFDIISTFPGLVLVLALIAVFGPSTVMLVSIMAFWRIPGYGRIARTEILSMKNETFIQAARALGAPRRRIIFSHMLPNAIPPIIVLAGMDLGVVVMGLAGLSFLGLGIQPPTPSWGRMLSEGYRYVRQSPWPLLWSSIVLIIIMIGCSLFSSGLREALNPSESYKG
ncbi:MAG: ABC transporter permease [Spirochaetales bacterium]|jgi:peptide/nickel transport system permease protein|nr:ABC transporter permease [Spirochaetales bacterium]